MEGGQGGEGGGAGSQSWGRDPPPNGSGVSPCQSPSPAYLQPHLGPTPPWPHRPSFSFSKQKNNSSPLGPILGDEKIQTQSTWPGPGLIAFGPVSSLVPRGLGTAATKTPLF